MPLSPEQAIDRIRDVFHPPPGYRTLHAKGAFYTGTFRATPEAGARCKAAHLQGEEVPVLVRWSNGGGNPKAPDGAPDVRGIAVSFRPPGAGATDLLGQTAPRFPVRTPEAFVDMVEAAQRPTLPLFLARNPSAVVPLLANLKARAIFPPRSYAEVTYYPIHAYSWTDHDGEQRWVRYVLRPLAGPADRPEGEFEGRDRLRDELAARLERAPVRYTLEVTVAGPDDDPHDPMSVWKSKETFDAGTLSVTEVADDPEADGDVVVFDPTRVIDGIGLSDDPILRFRPGAYSASVEHRLPDTT